MSELQETFGQRLRRFREAAGFSQETLAERADLSANAVSALERGDRKRPYPDTVRRLADALGLSDQERLELVGSLSRGRSEPSPVPTPLSPGIGLPADFFPLIGREREIEVVRHLLLHSGTRLLTLTGPGGVGKTRLALNVARSVEDRFPDGVIWVDLSPLADADLVLPAIGKAIGLKATPGELSAASLAAAIGGRKALLLLDNLEHLLSAATGISELVALSAGLVILATSRAPLNVRGEQEYVVPPLELPPAEITGDLGAIATIPAVALFVQQVRHKRPSFALDASNATDVAGICRRLDGVPLALELAAARVHLLGVNELLARLDTALPVLTGGKRDLPARQQTMEGTIRWSYDLLSPSEQALFRRLSVFAGGWPMEAAEAIVSAADEPEIDVLDALATLVDHHLVQQEPSDDSVQRLSMLDTFREFGRKMLHEHGEDTAIASAHLKWYLALAETAEPYLHGPTQHVWLDRLAVEHDNIRAALASQVDGTEELKLRLCAAIWRFWYMRGHYFEGRAWLERCLDALPIGDEHIRAKALNGAGLLAQESGDVASAARFYDESLALRRKIGDRKGMASTLTNLGLLADHRGDFDAAITLYNEALDLSRELSDRLGIANALNNLGLVARDIEDFNWAEELHTESLTILRELREQRGTANALNNLANIASDRGDIEQATRLHTESLAIRRELADQPGIAMSLKNLANMARDRGDTHQAVGLYRESLLIRRALGDRLGSIPTLGDIAVLAGTRGAHRECVRLVTATDILRDLLGAPAPPAIQRRNDLLLEQARAAIPPESFAESRHCGQNMSGDEAIDDALAFLRTIE